MRNNRPVTWRVLEWKNEPAKKDYSIPLCCECGRYAECPAGVLVGGLLIAGSGMGLIFDPPSFKPPDGWMPDVIQCRKCGRIYGDEQEVKKWEKEAASVR